LQEFWLVLAIAPRGTPLTAIFLVEAHIVACARGEIGRSNFCSPIYRGIEGVDENSRVNLYFLSRYADIRGDFFGTDQQHSPQRLGYWDRLTPTPPGNFLNFFQIPPTDPEYYRLCADNL
jgi:hypothetical protein